MLTNATFGTCAVLTSNVEPAYTVGSKQRQKTITASCTLTPGYMHVIPASVSTALTLTMPTLDPGDWIGITAVTSGHTVNSDGVRSFYSPTGATSASYTIASDEKAGVVFAAIDTNLLVVSSGVGGATNFAAGELIMYAATRVGITTPLRYLVANTVAGQGYLTLLAGTSFHPKVDQTIRDYRTTSDITLPVASLLDTGTIAGGKDYYVYLVYSATGWSFVVSLNSSCPTTVTAGYQLLIGGFHTLCVAAGTITPIRTNRTAHPLSGYLAGAILPQSVWTLGHRSSAGNAGMVYLPVGDCWVDIYNLSGTISTSLVGTCSYNVASVYGGTRVITKDAPAFEAALLSAGKSLPSAAEFVEAADCSNEGTAVAGSAVPSPDTTGGRVDTASRRMLSWCGCEEMCGLAWCWTRHTVFDSGSGVLVNSLGYSYNTAMVPVIGGDWSSTTSCGSRYISYSGRAGAYNNTGGRGRARAIHSFSETL